MARTGSQLTKPADESDSHSDSDSEEDLEVASWTHGTDGVVDSAFSVSQLMILKGTTVLIKNKHRPRMARRRSDA